MGDERFQHPSVGTLAVMIDGQRELRFYPMDYGHKLGLMVCENYRPTLNVHDPKLGGPSGASTSLKIGNPYTIRRLIEALEELEERGKTLAQK